MLNKPLFGKNAGEVLQTLWGLQEEVMYTDVRGNNLQKKTKTQISENWLLVWLRFEISTD